jgi:hypothetical protein
LNITAQYRKFKNYLILDPRKNNTFSGLWTGGCPVFVLLAIVLQLLSKLKHLFMTQNIGFCFTKRDPSKMKVGKFTGSYE